MTQRWGGGPTLQLVQPEQSWFPLASSGGALPFPGGGPRRWQPPAASGGRQTSSLVSPWSYSCIWPQIWGHSILLWGPEIHFLGSSHNCPWGSGFPPRSEPYPQPKAHGWVSPRHFLQVQSTVSSSPSQALTFLLPTLLSMTPVFSGYRALVRVPNTCPPSLLVSRLLGHCLATHKSCPVCKTVCFLVSRAFQPSSVAQSCRHPVIQSWLNPR